MSQSPPLLHAINFAGRCALVRVDFNVPLDKHLNITNDSRIRASLPTLKKIITDGGRCVIMTHLGRPQGKTVNRYSLKPIASALGRMLDKSIHFAGCCVGEGAEKKAAALPAGEVLLLENLRFHEGEKTGSATFAKQLSALGDVYVNDAFGAAHRSHASIAVVPRFFENKCMGLAMAKELSYAQRVLEQAESPFVAIIGGAKISDKITLLDKLLNRVNRLIIGGGMAYTFCRAMGGSVGNSLVEADKLDVAKALLEKAKAKGTTLLLPMDSEIGDKLDADAHVAVAESMNIEQGWMGLDIGPEARRVFADAIAGAKTILWNGPMGVFELQQFEQGTKAIAKAVAQATDQGAFSLVGGGDSVAAVSRFNLNRRMSHVSTGGGALLAYFEGKPLPAIEALCATVDD